MGVTIASGKNLKRDRTVIVGGRAINVTNEQEKDNALRGYVANDVGTTTGADRLPGGTEEQEEKN